MAATISISHSTRRLSPSAQRSPLRRRAVRPASSSGVPARSSTRVSGATYRRRRAVVGTVLAVTVAVGAVAAHDVLAGSGGVPASAAPSRSALVRTTVTARPGDTLWSIASEHHGNVAMTRFVDTLVDLNGGASIQAGQAVVLP